MLKQKTFIFNGNELYNVKHISSYEDKIIWNEDIINNKIDDFLKGKELVSLNTTHFYSGNNPPRHALIYTIVYKENS